MTLVRKLIEVALPLNAINKASAARKGGKAWAALQLASMVGAAPLVDCPRGNLCADGG